MKPNYQSLGYYIEEVNVKNKDLKETNLLGLKNDKRFAKSQANTVGTNFKNYKVVLYNQFVYMPTTSRNGDKISIALLKDKSAIISSSYTIFKVIDESKLNPDFLMMWFNRSEFDRYARYMSHGSVREIFSWEEMCNIKINLPNLNTQNKIVNIKQIFNNRIHILNSINQNLEKLCVAQFKQNFLLRKPFEDELMKDSPLGEIPKSWNVVSIVDFVDEMKNGGTPRRGNDEYWVDGDIPWLKTKEVDNSIIVNSEEFITKKGLKNSSAKLLPINTVIMALYGKGTAGRVGLLKFEATTNQACCAMICNNPNKAIYLYLYLLINQKKIESFANGSVQQNLSKDILENFEIIVPPDNIINNANFNLIFNKIENNIKENQNLTQIRDTLLPKLMSGEIDVSKIEVE